MISPIQPVAATLPSIQPASITNTPSTTGPANSFMDLLGQAIQSLDGTEQTANADATNLMTGQSTDVSTAMIDMQKAQVAFGTAVQVRNNLVSAYQSIMSMQI